MDSAFKWGPEVHACPLISQTPRRSVPSSMAYWKKSLEKSLVLGTHIPCKDDNKWGGKSKQGIVVYPCT